MRVRPEARLCLLVTYQDVPGTGLGGFERLP